jgi:hypothetical protein
LYVKERRTGGKIGRRKREKKIREGGRGRRS